MESIADRMSSIGTPKGHSSMPDPDPSGDAGGHSELHSHGNGTYHTVTDGEKAEHPSIGHALIHMGMRHEPEGAHSHVHHAEEGHTSHHGKDGEVSGPHDHENLEALKSHMGKFLDEEEGQEYKHDGADDGMWED